jgi:hypothetical protein
MEQATQALLQQHADQIIGNIRRLERLREREEGEVSAVATTEDNSTDDSDDENETEHMAPQSAPQDLSINTIGLPPLPGPPHSQHVHEETIYDWDHPTMDAPNLMDTTGSVPLPVNRILVYPEVRNGAYSPTSPTQDRREENDDQADQENVVNETQNQQLTITIANTPEDQQNMESTNQRLPIPRRRSHSRSVTQQQNTRVSSAPSTMTLIQAKKRKIFDQSCEQYPVSTNNRTWHDVSVCPVCSDPPRLGPIYTCSKGHLICQKCNEIVDTCPLCRDPILKNRSRISEFIIEKYLKYEYTTCINEKSGCKQTGTLQQLYNHEIVCPYTTITCPGKIQTCTWKGARITLPQHINVKNSCMDKVDSVDKWMRWNQGRSERYTNTIRDFGLEDNSIFKRNTEVTWKPILHNSNKTNPMWTYLIVRRSKDGYWRLQVKGYMSPKMALKFKARITITSAQTSVPNNGSNDNMMSPTYCGSITSHWTSDKDSYNMGRFLTVGDTTIAQMRHPTLVTKLFNYTVEIEHSLEIEQILKEDNSGLSPTGPKKDWNFENNPIPQQPSIPIPQQQ